MKKTTTVLFVGLLIATAVSGILPIPAGQALAQDKFTDADAKILQGSDPDAVAEILYKLVEIHDAQGKDAMKPAVPALIACLDNELKIPEDERWNLVDIVKVLSLSGDERAKPSMLSIMSVMWGGGNPFTAQGFLKMGPSVIKDIADSLKSANPETKGRAALTLHNMHRFDESGTFFSKENRETIKKMLLDNLNDESVNVRIYSVVGLRSFGDKTVIPKLEYIEKHDAHKDSGGTYEVRIEATETLKALKGESQ